MRSARGRSALALLVVLALLMLFALPVVASADETEVPTDAAAVEAAAPEATPPPDHAADAAPDNVPAASATLPASSEAAPQAVAAVAKTPALANRPAFGSHLAKRAAALAAAPGQKVSATKRPPASNSVTKLSAPTPSATPGGGCSATVANYGLSGPVVTSTTEGDTTFTWTVTYTGTDGCESEGVSHITLTPCVAAIAGNYTKANDPSTGTYKWERNPKVGDQLILTFPGAVASGGSVATSIKKSTLRHSPSVTGPSCSEGGVCPNGYTFNTSISPPSAGSIAVTGDSAPYSTGDEVSLAVTTNGGYTFTGWSGDSTSTDNPLDITFGTDCAVNVTAMFNQICPEGYTLTTAALPVGAGSVAVSGDSEPYIFGEQATLTATAASAAHTFSAWSGDSTSSTNPLIVTFGSDCDVNVTANFEPVNNVCETWTVTVVTNGTVTSPNELLDKTEVYTTNSNGKVVTANAPANHSPANQQGTVSGLSTTVCSTTVTLNFTPDQGCVGDCGSPPPPPPVDLCPNLEGNQAAVPEGMVVNEAGDCVEPPVDACPNIEGDQEAVPEGMVVNEAGDCVEPPTDVCPNIEGDQAEVPEGMFINPETGECDEEEVLGEIIDRDPKPKPKPDVDPQEVAPSVLPSNVQAGVLPFTGTDLLPLLMLAGLLMVTGTVLTLRRPARAKK